MTGAERRLAELGIELPPPVAPVAAYVPTVRTGSLVFVSGQIPIEGGRPLTGKVGADLEVEEARRAARLACLNALAALRAECGTLDAVRRVVRVTVYVASAPGFTAQPRVADGASELLQDVFGAAGRHARVAVGVAELPLGVPVEVDLIAEVGG